MKSRQQLSFLPGEPALTPDYGRSSRQGAGQARQMARSEGSRLPGPDSTGFPVDPEEQINSIDDAVVHLGRGWSGWPVRMSGRWRASCGVLPGERTVIKPDPTRRWRDFPPPNRDCLKSATLWVRRRLDDPPSPPEGGTLVDL